MTNYMWITSKTKFDTLHFDSTSYIVHGSGTLLRFNEDGVFKSLSNDFYLVDDSVAWGEPLGNFKVGNWQFDKKRIMAKGVYTEGSSNRLEGKQESSVFSLKGDTLTSDEQEEFVPAKLITKDLNELFKREWPKYTNQSK